jgi:peptide/nickel transport system substrate-binding protein
MGKKKLLSVCLISLIVFFGVAASSSAETVLKIGTLGSDATSLDPHMSTKSQDKIIFPMIFNGLVRFKARYRRSQCD